jgi:hypothetical protein
VWLSQEISELLDLVGVDQVHLIVAQQSPSSGMIRCRPKSNETLLLMNLIDDRPQFG